MTGMEWFFVFAACFCVLAYHRAALTVWTLSFAILLLFLTVFRGVSSIAITVTWIICLLIFTPLNVISWRRQYLSRPILKFYRKIMPTMSRTEKEALAAGTVTWEGDLFRGAPVWKKLLSLPKPELTEEEQAFIDGPVETLCRMIDDWDITHNRADLPPEMWTFIREQGFFGMVLPKEHGGKGFSAFAHSQVLVKCYGRSSSVASTIAVPNSLGPGELILHYGTAEQKSYYLPRLARGEEIPCFALTGPDAGSDAGSIPDTGIVCMGEHEGKEVIGVRLNFNKRYITLAPVATVIGLAFKLYDPDHLIGKKVNIGITCALIPRHTAGMSIGRRHFPCNIVFQNGPIHGKDVFIPIDWLIGGKEMVGQGWRMLMECLAAGRAISLPSSSVGGAKVMTYATGAYARIRRQFKTPIGRFEGVEEVLARIAGHTYIIDAARSFAASAIDAGEKPAIASAIVKYHTTELGRMVVNDAMDVHGGKGICLGPNNYLGRSYQSIPIAITVEGANILTRSMIIFGQGAMRCHPYVFAELQAAKMTDDKEALAAFDKALMGHLSFSISNIVRTLVLSLTSGFFVVAPKGETRRYYQQATRFSSAFALMADMSLMLLGGALKRKESISARLGDVLSQLYLLSAVLKQHHDNESPGDDLPLIDWAAQHCLHQTQDKLNELLQNFPNRIAAFFLRAIIFPFGKNFHKPSDKLGHAVAQLIMSPTDTRARLCAGAFLSPVKENVLASVEDALLKTIICEPIEKIMKAALKEGTIDGDTPAEQAKSALKKHIISKDQYKLLQQADEARELVIAVDDFATEDLARIVIKTSAEETIKVTEARHD
ncbi:MAG: acyl-CoA dehydrogenase [Gammaproteobacteria bacterium]|nr:acyl-CoA dehydrogenase [Gammaproteobacteria bacterium]